MFDLIKSYLKRIHNANYEIIIDEPNIFQFKICSKCYEKFFTVHYRDGSMRDNLDSERPTWHHFYLQFEQPDYPSKGQFYTLIEWKWFIDEESVLDRIKILKNRYQH